MSSLNVVKLKEITNANPTAKVVYAALQSRKRARSVTDLRQFQGRLEGQGVNNDDYYAFFKGLEEAGAGSMVFRRSKPPRFKWNYSLKDVVAQMSGKPPATVTPIASATPPVATTPTVAAEPTPVNPTPIKKRKKAKATTQPVAEIPTPSAESQAAVASIPTSNVHALPVRAKLQVSIMLQRKNGETIAIKIPADLSQEEANEIGDLFKGKAGQ